MLHITTRHKDYVLNIISSMCLIMATQLIAYPYLSRIMSGSEYGLLLTIMAIVNAVGVSLGNPLNNTRILQQHEYDQLTLDGDFNLIFLSCALIDIVLVGILTTIILHEFDIRVTGCIFISLLVLFRSYYSAGYRIIIDYKKNLISSIFGFSGYMIGLILTYYTKNWLFTFISGELFACIYIYISVNIVHDKLQFTPLIKKTILRYGFFMSAAVMSMIMTYMDRFFLFPFLGAEQVTVFTVASFLGKTAGIIMTPVAAVMLTYYALDEHISIREFYKRTGSHFLLAALFYLITLVIGVPITRLLYPTIIDRALPFFAVANLASIVFILGNTIQPTLLRYCNAKWQPILQGTYLSIYLIFGYFSLKHSGLMGFCYSVLAVNILKILLMLLITTLSLYEQEKKGVLNHV